MPQFYTVGIQPLPMVQSQLSLIITDRYLVSRHDDSYTKMCDDYIPSFQCLQAYPMLGQIKMNKNPGAAALRFMLNIATLFKQFQDSGWARGYNDNRWSVTKYFYFFANFHFLPRSVWYYALHFNSFYSKPLTFHSLGFANNKLFWIHVCIYVTDGIEITIVRNRPCIAILIVATSD